MQEEKINLLSEQMPEKQAVSIGALLVDARNHVALSQADVADQINLPLSTIIALENDAFDQLPESTYIRGYLRNYARAVGIDAENLVSVYNQQHHVESEIIARKSSKHSYDSAILWSTAIVLTILVGLLVNWWMDVRQPPEESVEIVKENSTTVNSNDVSQVAALNTDTPEDGFVNQSEQEVEQISDLSIQQEQDQSLSSATDEEFNTGVDQAMAEESDNPNLVTLNDGSDVLTVTYVEKSWTEIRDADLNPLMQGLIEPGVVRNLSGKAPFHVFLGNSPGVVIEVNGQYFDQSQFNRSNRTARFQVSSGSFN